MTLRDDLQRIVDEALDEFNDLLSPEEKVRKAPGTRLLAADGKLDSMGAITLVVALDSGLVRRFGHSAGLTENPRIFEVDGPMRSVGALVDFLEGLHFEQPAS